MYPFKVILNGSLEFGTQRSYESMMANLQKRTELYYKNDTLLKDPLLFSEDVFTLTFSRFVKKDSTEKTWKNTLFLLRELKSFAVAGELHFWVFDAKEKLCCYEAFVPQGDKAATSYFNQGVRSLEDCEEDKAIELFTKAIEKYPRYAQAYERRGMAYYQIGKYNDALIDFSKSIGFNQNADAYYGRGLVRATIKEWSNATLDFQAALDSAVAHLPVYWLSRRGKGECHIELQEWEKALHEFKYLSKRPFKESDPNYAYRKQAWENYGKMCLKCNDTKEATKAFKEALAIEDCVIVENMLKSINANNSSKVTHKAEVLAN